MYISILFVLATFVSDKGGKCVCPRSFVCLSVCLSVSKITQKRVHGFGWNVACRQMSEPDCFLRYRMRCNVEFYYVWKIPRICIGRLSLQRGVVSKWFYSPRAVGTPLSEVHALYRVPLLVRLMFIPLQRCFLGNQLITVVRCTQQVNDRGLLIKRKQE